MDATTLIFEAERRCGLSDWGGEELHESSFRELFASLVNSVETEASMTARGRLSAELRLPALLDARLSLVEERKRIPTIRTRRIDRPLFVLGLPRTGSSFLQALLAQDPDNIAPTTSDFFFPSAFQAWQGNGPDTRLQRTHEIQQALGMFDPDIQAMHPWGDTQPEECMFSMELAGWSEQLSASWRVPGYNRLRNGHLHAAFAMHRTVLQHLQHHMPGQRFALKSPGHLLRLQALLTEYPDAMIVQTHRDPAKAIPSLCALLMHAHPVYEADRREERAHNMLTREVAKWARDIRRSDKVREKHPGQVLDVVHADFHANPMAVLDQIYSFIGMEIGEDLRGAFARRIADKPELQHGVHKYDLADFGMSAERVREQFCDYVQRYDLVEKSK